MIGYGNGSFGPNDPLTRADFTQVLCNIAFGETKAITTQFTDVHADDWFAPAVSWAYENGVVKGVTETTFGPEIALSREMCVTMLYRYAQSAGLDVSRRGDLSGFADVADVDEYAVEAFQWAVGCGILIGDEGSHLLPLETTTRAQFAAMLHRCPAGLI